MGLVAEGAAVGVGARRRGGLGERLRAHVAIADMWARGVIGVRLPPRCYDPARAPSGHAIGLLSLPLAIAPART